MTTYDVDFHAQHVIDHEASAAALFPAELQAALAGDPNKDKQLATTIVGQMHHSEPRPVSPRPRG